MSAEGETQDVAPVETAPVVPDKPVVVADATPETPERDEKGKFRNPLQPRIDELTRQRREAEREAAYWRQRNESREAQDSAAAAAPKKPTIDQYESYDAYVEALADFKAGEKVKVALSEHDKAAEAARQAETRKTTWAERQTAAKAKLTDYDAVLSSSEVTVAGHVVAALDDAERGPELIYHLAKNPEIADRLNKLSPLAAAREIGRIEASLPADEVAPDLKEAAAETPEPAPAPTKRPTAAPPPAKPLQSGRSTQVELAKAGMDDYVKTRRAQGARWAR